MCNISIVELIQLSCTIIMTIAIVVALFQQKINDHFRHKPDLTILVRYLDAPSLVVTDKAVTIVNFVEGDSCSSLTIPYMDVIIENKGYHDVRIDDLFIGFCKKRYRTQRTANRHKPSIPISMKNKTILCEDKSVIQIVFDSPELPTNILSGHRLQFRISPAHISNFYARSPAYKKHFKEKYIKHGFVAFVVTSVKYSVTQCSRITANAFFDCKKPQGVTDDSI